LFVAYHWRSESAGESLTKPSFVFFSARATSRSVLIFLSAELVAYRRLFPAQAFLSRTKLLHFFLVVENSWKIQPNLLQHPRRPPPSSLPLSSLFVSCCRCCCRRPPATRGCTVGAKGPGLLGLPRRFWTRASGVV